MKPVLAGCCCNIDDDDEIDRLQRCGIARHTPAYTRRVGAPSPSHHPVYVNVYHLIEPTINTRLRQLGFGIFHAGVQLFNDEWSFGAPISPLETSGVFSVAPMDAMDSLYRHVFVGWTLKTREQIKTIIRRVRCEWLAAEYHVTEKNCNHFCEALCELLSCPQSIVLFPRWINRASRLASCFVPRPLASWIVHRIASQDIPKCACVDYNKNIGSDMRAEARRECLHDHVAMQYQVIALMSRPPRASTSLDAALSSPTPPRPTASRVGGITLTNSGREPPSHLNQPSSPSEGPALRHIDPLSGTVPPPRRPGPSALDVSRTVTFVTPPPRMPAVSPLTEPPVSPERVFPSRGGDDVNGLGDHREESDEKASTVLAESHGGGRVTPLPAPSTRLVTDDDECSYTQTDYRAAAVLTTSRAVAAAAAQNLTVTSVAPLTSADEISELADTTAKVVTRADGQTQPEGGTNTTLHTAGISENNAFLQRDDDEDDGLSIDETATWSHAGPAAGYSPRGA